MSDKCGGPHFSTVHAQKVWTAVRFVDHNRYGTEIARRLGSSPSHQQEGLFMAKRRLSIADQLRRAIHRAERRGITRYRISQRSGISQAQLSRLMSRQVAPRIDTAERIAQALGYRIMLLDKK